MWAYATMRSTCILKIWILEFGKQVNIIMSDTRRLQSPDAPLFGNQSPPVAGFLRGGLFAVLLAAIGAAVTYLTETPAGDLAVYSPIAIVVLTTVAGIIDKKSAQG